MLVPHQPAEVLLRLHERRASGESVKVMAAEFAVTWQKLDKAIRNGLPTGSTRDTTARRERAHTCSRVPPCPAPGCGTLADRYRPRTLADLAGQESIVAALRQFTADPYSAAFLFHGDTGTGKTSAAHALAGDLGCRLDEHELGGLNAIASGEQSADAIREITDRLRLRPMYGSGWRVLIVNECERMHPQAETIWLDRLENLPPKTVIVFTTNNLLRLSQRFRDRCVPMHFTAERQVEAAAKLLARIWLRETGEENPWKQFRTLARRAEVEGGRMSFRRAVQLLGPELVKWKR